MNIEIVEFYPKKIDFKKKFAMGSMHIYLIDYDMDIRGMIVILKGDKVLVFFPQKKSVDMETGQEVNFPVINFTDGEKNKLFIKEVVKKSRKYLKNFFKKR